MNDVVIFINKMKKVFELLPDEDIDTYNNIYNNYPTEEFIAWINKQYQKLYFNKI